MMVQQLFDKRKRVSYATDAHQHLAFDHLMDNPRAALFLGMGLSKTVVALSYLYEMHYREAAFRKTLVVAPDKVARITWPDEAETWAHLDGLRYSVVAGTAAQRLRALRADAEVFIVGVDNVVWLVDQFGGKLPYDCVVIDELDKFKNHGSKRFKKLRRAIRSVDYRVGMTGTPQPNGLTDLWAEICLLDDGARLGETWGRFVDKYFTTRGNGMIVYEYRPRPGATAEIAHKLRDIALTVSTRSALKLPALITDDVRIAFTPKERADYDRLEREFVLALPDGGEVTAKTAADLTMKLLQVSSGAIYGEDGWRELNRAKINALRSLLDAHPSETFVVVYQFRHEVERVQEAFPFARMLRRGKAAVQDVRDWNDGKIRLLLIHPASAGHGLNLQFGGRRMVWFSLTWDMGQYQQTVARLLRRGATRDVYVHRLIVSDTMDVRVVDRQTRKELNQDFLLNTIKSLRKKWADERVTR